MVTDPLSRSASTAPRLLKVIMRHWDKSKSTQFCFAGLFLPVREHRSLLIDHDMVRVSVAVIIIYYVLPCCSCFVMIAVPTLPDNMLNSTNSMISQMYILRPYAVNYICKHDKVR